MVDKMQASIWEDISSTFEFIFFEALPRFWQGLLMTLIIAGLGILIGFCLGILVGAGRGFGGKFISKLCGLYTEIIRGIPLIVQILIWRYAFPGLIKSITGYDIYGPFMNPGMIATIIAIGLNSGAYQAEIIRAGINAIPTGQTEAGLSVGLSKKQVIQLIVLPQALRHSIPPLINEFVIVIKDTSLALAVGVTELTSIAQSLTSDAPGQVFTIYITSALIYLAICTTVSFLSKFLEKKLKIAGYGTQKRRSLL
ncbi:ABC transporter permease subunit [Candidatus Bathyarchaeota archaeon]|nr:ABC transporter permease subunit [Candidatus Bathyarchaeota archaeon]